LAAGGYKPIMTNVDPQQSAEPTLQDDPGSAPVEKERADRMHAEQEHPEQEAHGGSMAPGLVDDTGRPRADSPAAEQDR
jgi:hypothetical protein